MNYERFFTETRFSQEGQAAFLGLHSRMSDDSFAESCSEAFSAYNESDEAFGAYITDFAKRENVSAEALTLYLYIRFSEHTYDEYKKRGISDEVFYETMSDFDIKSRQNFDASGIYGITQEAVRPWLRLHLGCKLYKLGRLQFEIINSKHDFELDGKSIQKGDLCLNVHITRYAPLTEAECEESYALARNFFKKYYNIGTCFFFCESWLLHPWLSDALPEESKILKFQKKFTILETIENKIDPLYCVFFRLYDNIDDYPEDTTLRRHLKRLLKEDLPFGNALGIRL